MKTLTQGRPLKVILLFAVPLYIGQLFQLCYSLFDTRIIGGALGEVSLAAVGATAALSDLLIEFLNGVICGFGVIIAKVYGGKDEKKLKAVIGATVTLSVLATLLISGVCLLFLPRILHVLQVDQALAPEALSYIRIIIAGLLATSLYNICTAVLRSVGDSFTPLVFLILANLLNIGLDYLLYAACTAAWRELPSLRSSPRRFPPSCAFSICASNTRRFASAYEICCPAGTSAAG